ncbi:MULTISPECIES: sensor histidine kinase [Marinobacter]|uniref:sensor histidine kinase n=1 Tax=Marinobacter TaxID=2742 RepID=UPI00124417A2|nr:MULTISPECIES: ATP-binding protein [Marinobacter]MBL3557588.1 PAS domain S-box protein [Marinobacter sp. JB05H06]
MTMTSAVTDFQLPDTDPEAGLVLGADSTVLASNPTAKALSREAGRVDIAELLPTNAQALINACLTQGRAIEGVERRLPGLILLWTFIPDPASGQVLARGRNATDDVHKLDEATRSSRLYRLITENTTDLISRHAPDGRFIDATPASWRLLGYWPEELRGKPLEEVFRSSTINGELEDVRNRLRDEGYATLTLDIVHRDGSKRWFEIASRAIRETYTGAVIEVVSVSRDITARVESEENNRRLADELAHTARLATLGELASSIAHEMNQPLATIVNFASASQRYLKHAKANPECLDRVDDGLQRITHHANRASEVIRRLRAFLRKGPKRTAPISINDAVVNVKRLCQWDAEKNNVVIRERLSDSNPVITADPVLLEQVLVNLIRNGIDANIEAHPDGTTSSQVTVTTCVTSGQEILIEVADQGPGLDDEGLRQMFTPFYTSKPHGLGLGLSMSRSIVEGFGGFLDAQRGGDGGLVLICRFPLPHTNKNRSDHPREKGQNE